MESVPKASQPAATETEPTHKSISSSRTKRSLLCGHQKAICGTKRFSSRQSEMGKEIWIISGSLNCIINFYFRWLVGLFERTKAFPRFHSSYGFLNDRCRQQLFLISLEWKLLIWEFECIVNIKKQIMIDEQLTIHKSTRMDFESNPRRIGMLIKLRWLSGWLLVLAANFTLHFVAKFLLIRRVDFRFLLFIYLFWFSLDELQASKSL